MADMVRVCFLYGLAGRVSYRVFNPSDKVPSIFAHRADQQSARYSPTEDVTGKSSIFNFQSSIYDLSVVIVSFNSRDVLLPCLESIYASSPRLSLEVILVDNGSKDGSLEEVRRRFAAVTIIESGYNAGYTGGNNIGYRHAAGRNVLFLNPDTLIKHGVLDGLVSRADSDPQCGAVGPRILRQDGSLQPSCYPPPTVANVLCSVLLLDYIPGWESFSGIKTHYRPDEYSQEMEVGAVSGCCLLVPKRVLDEIGAFDEDYWMYGEEDDLCERIRKSGYRILYSPSVSIVHLGGLASKDLTLRWRIHVEHNRRLFFAKHRSKASLLAIRAILLLDTIRRIFVGSVQMILTGGCSKKYRLKVAQSLGLLCWQVGLIKQANRPA